jgi:hypothetical protein
LRQPAPFEDFIERAQIGERKELAHFALRAEGDGNAQEHVEAHVRSRLEALERWQRDPCCQGDIRLRASTGQASFAGSPGDVHP